MTLLLAALVTVSALVVETTGAPLPGVTVTLSNGTLTSTAVTGADGRYTFAGVSEGTYDFRYELAGLETAEQRAHTGDVRTQILDFGPLETVTFACSLRPCSDEPPATPYDLPLCTDYDLNATWLEAAAKGDRSARELLRARYAQTLSLAERHHIGPALLDDSSVWNDLFARAGIVLRFPRVDDDYSPAFLAWCDARGLPPDHWYSSHDAFVAICKDPRSRPLLRKALQSDDWQVASIGVMGLAEQRDHSSLASIDETLRRFPGEAAMMAACLTSFASPAADEIAMKHLDDELRAVYEKARGEQR